MGCEDREKGEFSSAWQEGFLEEVMPELALGDEEEFVRGNSNWQQGHLVFHKCTMTL